MDWESIRDASILEYKLGYRFSQRKDKNVVIK